jgi:uncharacterized protein YkwD
MKTIVIAIFTLVSISCFSQAEKIESTKLDSLIWKKINEYRISKGVKPFIVFEDSLMRQFCTRVAYRNFDKKIPLHSDSVGYWSNAECLYRYSSSGTSSINIINSIDRGDLECLAERAVQSWIHSPTHEMAISRPEYNIATVVAIISIDHKNNTILFDATFHALDKKHTTFNGYVCQVTKKGNR